VRGSKLALLANYLEGRSQYVVYDGVESEGEEVRCGVPQGSVLGPLFFLLYVNDMGRVSDDLNFVLFADDTNIFAEGRDPVQLFRRVNGGLGELDRWFRCNRLTLNLKKTEYVYFAGPGRHGETLGRIQVGGGEVKRAEGRVLARVFVG
jgi:hypothetical protein